MTETVLPDSHGLLGILCDITLFLGHIASNSIHIGKFVIVSSMLAFTLMQYMDSHVGILVFSMAIWLF